MTLRSTIATPEGKHRYVRRLFATIAHRYDFITRFLSYGQDRRWKRRLIALAAMQTSDRVLDLACGTGDLTHAAAKHARRVVGLDLTYEMLQLAQRRAIETGLPGAHGGAVEVHPDSKRLLTGRPTTFVAGDMLALPFAPASFDVITIGYGLRNVPDLEVALSEIHRVITPGGRLLSLDFNRPGSLVVRGAYLTYLTVVGSTLGWILHRDPNTYRYIPESIRLYPGAARVAVLIKDAGFSDVKAIPVFGGLMAIHTARKP